jgi:hypothetical protein
MMLARWYRSAAIIFLNFLILFVLANLACSLYMEYTHPRFGPLAVYPLSLTMKAYPGWSEKDVEELLRETYYDARPTYDVITQVKERSTSGRFVNVDPAGFRRVRDQGPWPPDASAVNVFMFGGSTTFGYGVEDSQTIASHLQDLVESSKPPVHIYNFGRASYTSTQEMLLYLSLVRSGHVPNIAIFFDGINDGSSWHEDEWLYGKMLAERIDQSEWSKAISLAADFPLLSVTKNLIGVVVPESGPQISPKDVASLVIANYQTNQRIIRALCSLYGTKPVFIWQPTPIYKYDLSRHFMAGDKKYGYFLKMSAAPRAIATYQEVERLAANNSFGDGFVFMADIAEDKDRNRYVDANHYNGEFSADIATHILSFLRGQHLVQ